MKNMHSTIIKIYPHHEKSEFGKLWIFITLK